MISTLVEIFVAAGIVVLLAIVVGSLTTTFRDRHKAPPRIGYRVTVHTMKPDDQTIFGVIVGDYADRIVLEDAEYVHTGGNKPLPGRQHIQMDHISWMDVHANVAVPSAVEEGMYTKGEWTP